MEVWDSPNSAGVVIDAVRCAKLALDRGIGGPLEGPAAYLMKTPPRQYTDDQARQLLEEFIAGSGVVAPELEAPARGGRGLPDAKCPEAHARRGHPVAARWSRRAPVMS